MNKTLATEHIADELGRSAFFSPPKAARPTQAPPPEPPNPPSSETGQRVHARGTVAPSDPSPGRSPVDPNARILARRTIARCSFEIFQDQMEWLRQVSLADKFAGGKGSMSEMVREALDRYREALERPNG